MNEKTKKAILEEMAEAEDVVPSFLISHLANKYNVSYNEVSNLFYEPYGRLYQSGQPVDKVCYYCGLSAASFNFFDEPVCPECGG